MSSLVPFYDNSYGFFGNIFTNAVGTTMTGAATETTCIVINQTKKSNNTSKTGREFYPKNNYVGYIHGRAIDPYLI